MRANEKNDSLRELLGRGAFIVVGRDITMGTCLVNRIRGTQVLEDKRQNSSARGVRCETLGAELLAIGVPQGSVAEVLAGLGL